MSNLRYRQVHLDFHSSGLMEGIGEEFEKEQFQEELKTGHVDSITVFSKCHHGYSYHPTKVNEIHPNLKYDLLKSQLDACKEINIKSPVYISAGFDEKEAVRHPEWLVREMDESTTGVKDFVSEAGFHLLCLHTGYLDLLLRQIEEVMICYNPDGIFLDISSVHPCYCATCRNTLLAEGKDPTDIQAVMEQAEIVYKNYAISVESLVHKYSQNCTIFHNAGHITRGRRDLAGYNTHLELESLPTGGWGYDHFPMSASYVSNLSQEYLGMTGKFHSTWGEFGGFKHPNALRYETSLSVAFGAKCSIGDQLHPSGKMDSSTYKLIGAAYSEIEKKEPWLKGGVNIADIGVLGEEAVNSSVSNRDVKYYSDIGANRIMLEGKYLYRFIDLLEDLNKFKLIILPDSIELEDSLLCKILDYLKNGGKILASGRSGLAKGEKKFVLPFGAEYLHENLSKPNYIVPKFPFTTGNTPHVMYEQGHCIKVTDGKKMAVHQNSYFNREVYRFCSHQHTPNQLEEGGDAISITEQTAYIGWNIFTDYSKMGSLHLKEIVCYCIEQLIGKEKTLATDLVDRGVVTLVKQENEKRYINHLLFAHTTIRGKFDLLGKENLIEVIEGIVPVYETKVKLRVKEKAKRVYLAPQGETLKFTQIGDVLEYSVSKIDCHQMAVIEWEAL